MNRGYAFEYLTMKRIQKKGVLILRLAKSGFADFIVLDKLPYLLEVKTTKKKRFYPSQREINQFLALKEINRKYKIDILYRIREEKKEKTLTLEEVEREYFKNG